MAESSFREAAKEFASGFGKGVRDEGERIYRDAQELPERIAKTGRELVEDVKEGRKLRALAPIEAMGHALQNASSDDVERLAHGVIDSARDWYHKPAREKGESLGRATMSMASDAAISVLTDGLGTVASLRKAERAAEAAEHVRDVERGLERAAKTSQRIDNATGHIPHHGTSEQSSRAARRQVMRDQDIPTSQQPISQSKNASGRSFEYEVAAPGGGTEIKSVQQQTLDRSHPGQPHWEAGRVKTDPLTGEVRMTAHGRPKLTNDKSKVSYP